MQRNVLGRFSSFLIASTAAAALFLGGCEGDRGPKGEPGAPGGAFTNLSTATTDQLANITFDQNSSTVDSVTIQSPPVVTFTLKTTSGQAVEGIGSRDTSGRLNNLGFSLAKLIPASNGTPSHWVNYIVTTVPTGGAAVAASRPTSDREGKLEYLGNGKYRYTFARDIKLIQGQVNAMTFTGNNRRNDLGDLTYDPTKTHRLVVAYGGNIPGTSPAVAYKNAINLVYDFVPATGTRVTSSTSNAAQRNIVLTKYCNECHGNPGDPNNLNEQGWGLGVTTPHLDRVDTRYCAICHTSQRAYGRAISTATSGAFTGNTYVTADVSTADPSTDEAQILGEFVTMVHKIHMGSNLTLTGYSYAGVHFNEVAYPQSAALCRKCHRADTAKEQAVTPQGNNWRTMPSRKACGACHDNVHFSTGTITEGATTITHPVQLNDASCNACHTPTAITESHAQAIVTPLNPEAPAGLTSFTYDLAGASVDASNNLTIKFRILNQATNTPITLATPAAGLTAALPGFTGSPSFLLAYAMPQLETGTAIPADYNNLGKVAAQPDAISIATLLNTNNAATGSITGPDGSGYYTATINAASAFPVGAKMRAVAMQSYFSQTGFDSSIAGRHTKAVIVPVTGDAVRRTVVDPDKCRNCHEFFEAHGGQRVYQTQVCVTCHNPNLTTSGRTISNTKLSGFNFTPVQLGILTTWDPAFNKTTAGYALTFPEFSNNFKDLIHGIHAGATRTDPIRDVRNGPSTGITLIAGEEITFPNMLGNCEACHVSQQSYTPDVVSALVPRALPSTQVTRSATSIATPTTATLTAARATVPNPEDLVVAPITAACVSCHDTPLAKAHMQANGAQLGAALNGPSYTDMGTLRTDLPSLTEQCVLCHGQGKVADVITMHAANRPAVVSVTPTTTTTSATKALIKKMLNW
ncbi:OmcA/MtrC family decaheme c-type cytochrome [Geomonas oryzae]|uniref:OmcA/MtrC family decaheme c-type cytochrome n=1 Tax=Geomonas oryzae TaxID=2364273 RepID=UPI00100BE889|nr:OmcA/MtrC family decaheme c-type cytochrome [Geomonas oryzae]